MPINSDSAILDAFFDRLRDAPARALMLDYDGTLAPFRIRAEEAKPYPGVRKFLDAIMGDGVTRVVIVSGRHIRDLVPLLGLARRPEIWGLHGWEQITADGETSIAPVSKSGLRQLGLIDAWCADIEALGGRCESKPVSIAIHWRGLDERSVLSLRRFVQQSWHSLEPESNLVWQEFDGGIELCLPGRDKGYAVTSVLQEMPAQTVAAYLGDDATDENAFAAMRGHGIGVLVRPEHRASRAGFWLRPPQQLLEFLKRWRSVCGGVR